MQAEPAQLPKAVILISGNGSNLQAIIDAKSCGDLNLEIAAVISNVPDAYGLERAKEAGINAHGLDHKSFESRDAFDSELIRTIERYNPQIVVLAGYMRILTDNFVNRYLGRLINIHPSLLPKYPGLNTHKKALESGDSVHGVTVHFVIPELDAGPNIIQALVEIAPDETEASLAQKVHKQEHIIYPIAIKWFCEGRLTLTNTTAFLDNEAIPETGLVLDNSRVLH